MIAAIAFVLGLALGFLAGLLVSRRRRVRQPITVVPPRAGDAIRGPYTREGKWRS